MPKKKWIRNPASAQVLSFKSLNFSPEFCKSR